MKSTGAQSSLEYLMTYGIAISIVLMSMSMLFYSGIIDLSKYMPQQTVFQYPIPNVDDAILYENGTLKILMVNSLGENITIVPDGYGGTGDFNPLSFSYNDTNILPNEVFEIRYNFNTNKTRMKGFLRFRYINDFSGRIHNQTGYVVVNKE